jgi:hypothetical protein
MKTHKSFIITLLACACSLNILYIIKNSFIKEEKLIIDSSFVNIADNDAISKDYIIIDSNANIRKDVDSTQS